MPWKLTTPLTGRPLLARSSIAFPEHTREVKTSEWGSEWGCVLGKCWSAISMFSTGDAQRE
eukprot:919699-Prorocentrum_minimum.AAC.2